MERINGRLGAAYVFDKEWVEATDARAAQARWGKRSRTPALRPHAPPQTLEKLEAELSAAKQSAVKVRVAAAAERSGGCVSGRALRASLR